MATTPQTPAFGSPVIVALRFRQQNVDTSTESCMVWADGSLGRGWGGSALAGGLDGGQVRLLQALYREALERAQAGGNGLRSAEIEPLRTLGNQLWQLLPSSVQEWIDTAFDHARQTARPLLLRLRFDPNARHWQGLPWELLHHPERRLFLALHGCAIVRELTRWSALAPLSDFHQLRWLGVWAEPPGAALALAQRRPFAPCPGDARGWEWIEGADTLGRLAARLREGHVTALHLVAHGQGGVRRADYALGLVSADNRVAWVDTPQLLAVLAAAPGLQVVCVEACSSGESAELPAIARPGTWLAEQLIAAGVQAVITMQGEISQRAAGQVMGTLYDEWERGAPLPLALLHGRQKSRAVDNDPLHWSVPTLTQRGPDRLQPPLAVRAANRWLDALTADRLGWVLVTGIVALLIGRISRSLGGAVSADTLQPLILPLLEAVLLPLTGAALLWPELQRLARYLDLTPAMRRNLIVHVLASSAVWSLIAWNAIALFWFVLLHAGIGLPPGIRQLVWAGCLALPAGAGFVGAQAALRLIEVSVSRERSYMARFMRGDVPLLSLFLLVPGIVTALAFAGIPPALLQEWLRHSGIFYGVIALSALLWQLSRAK